nr:immunoglobulin light chain junction region [Macaca mulatta]MOX57161.1 immunoglobulin light chain junction region [Macaca mulatta]
CMEGLEFPYSF